MYYKYNGKFNMDEIDVNYLIFHKELLTIDLQGYKAYELDLELSIFLTRTLVFMNKLEIIVDDKNIIEVFKKYNFTDKFIFSNTKIIIDKALSILNTIQSGNLDNVTYKITGHIPVKILSNDEKNIVLNYMELFREYNTIQGINDKSRNINKTLMEYIKEYDMYKYIHFIPIEFRYLIADFLYYRRNFESTSYFRCGLKGIR